MVKIKSTPCRICGKKYKGEKGLRMHERIDHKEVVDFFKEAEKMGQKIRTKFFTNKYEKSIISLEDRMSVMTFIGPDCNDHLHKLMVKWEKSQIRKLPEKHPIFKSWKFRNSPWKRFSDIFYEAVGYWATENYECYVKCKEVVPTTTIEEIFEKMMTPQEQHDLINYYHYRSSVWGVFWPLSVNERISQFIRFIMKTSHIKVMIGLKLIEGDGEYMLGEPDRCGPVDIRCHLLHHRRKN